MRFQQGEEDAYNDKRRLLLGLIVLIVFIIIGIVVYFMLDSGLISIPKPNIEEPKDTDSENKTDGSSNSTDSGNDSGMGGEHLEFDVIFIKDYDDITLKPIVRESSDYFWDDDIWIYVNVSDFGFYRGKDFKFVMLEGALDVVGPTGERIAPFSDEDAIDFEAKVKPDVDMIPFFLTIDTNYPQLKQYGLVGRYKLTLTITDSILEETESKTIYFNLNNW